MSAFKHERVLDLREFGEAHKCFYFVTSYYDEGNLAQWVRRNGRPTVERTMHMMFDVLDALAYIHARGYVHRDIKPQNILLGADGRPIIADFGLAKSFEESGFGDITKSGATAGTPLYMPREQIVNFKRVRPATDVWAAAAVLYWLLCGANARDIPPGESSFLSALRSPILSIRVRGVELPIALYELLDCALSDDPAQRPEHAGVFRAQLQNAMVHIQRR